MAYFSTSDISRKLQQIERRSKFQGNPNGPITTNVILIMTIIVIITKIIVMMNENYRYDNKSYRYDNER